MSEGKKVSLLAVRSILQGVVILLISFEVCIFTIDFPGSGDISCVLVSFLLGSGAKAQAFALLVLIVSAGQTISVEAEEWVFFK